MPAPRAAYPLAVEFFGNFQDDVAARIRTSQLDGTHVTPPPLPYAPSIDAEEVLLDLKLLLRAIKLAAVAG